MKRSFVLQKMQDTHTHTYSTQLTTSTTHCLASRTCTFPSPGTYTLMPMRQQYIKQYYRSITRSLCFCLEDKTVVKRKANHTTPPPKQQIEFNFKQETLMFSLYLFNASNVIYSQFFEGTLKFFVISCSCSVHHLLLSASCSLGRIKRQKSALLKISQRLIAKVRAQSEQHLSSFETFL